MLKKSVVLFLLVFTLVFSFGSEAKYQNTPEDQIFQTNPYSHLKYFGFYASAMGSWNFTEELAPHSNLTWIHVWNLNEFVSRTKEAKEVGVKAVLSIEKLIFEDEQGNLRATADIEDDLIELRALLENEDLMDTVVMIFPKDEPYREFKRFRDLDNYDEYVTGETQEEIYNNLEYANRLIKLVFPETPIGVNFSGYDVLDKFFKIPPNYDWVGFDCYRSIFKNCNGDSFIETYYGLLDHMQPHMRLMAVPEAWVANGNENKADFAKILMSRMRHHYEIALSEPRFIAVIPFIYSFKVPDQSTVPGNGLDTVPDFFDLPGDPSGTEFRDYVLDIGAQIKHQDYEYPNMAYSETEASGDRPKLNIKGKIMTINRRGLISAWAYNYALQHKNLRVQVKIKDPSGNLIHTSPVERTFINDRSLIIKRWVNGIQIGNHGYRYQIPQSILDQYGGQSIGIEFVTYADGPGLNWAHSFNRDFRIWKPGVRFPHRPIGERDYYFRRFGRRIARP